MGFVRWVCVVTVVLACYGCNTDKPPTDDSLKPADKSISRKLAVVSPAFLSLEQDLTRPQGVHDELLVVAKDGNGSAYIERSGNKYRVVHNGRAGKSYQLVGDLTISGDGKRVAYVAHINDTGKSIIADGREGLLFTDIGMPKFSPDGKHLVYTITQGKEDRLVIDHKMHSEHWVSQDLLVSPDSRFIAFAAMPPGGGQIQYVISDFTLQDRKVFESCGESIAASDDLSRIAVVCSEAGSRSIKILDFKSRSLISTLETPAAGAIVRKRFAADNRSFVYTIMTDDYQRFLHYNGRVEGIPKGDEIMSDPLVLTDPERVGVIIGNAFNVRFFTAFQKNRLKEKEYGYISDFVSSPDGRYYAYVAVAVGAQAGMRIVVDGNEGPLFDKIVSPIFSPDGRFLAYRVRHEGRRFIVISDLKGKIIRRHKDYDMVFQPEFADDGTYVAYSVLDGNELWWKVEKL